MRRQYGIQLLHSKTIDLYISSVFVITVDKNEVKLEKKTAYGKHKDYSELFSGKT